MPNSNSLTTTYNILVTGSMGQLGSEIKELASKYSYNFFFTDRNNIDITSKDSIKEFCQTNSINVIINCAAYTAVDKAETDIENADFFYAQECREKIIPAFETIIPFSITQQHIDVAEAVRKNAYTFLV